MAYEIEYKIVLTDRVHNTPFFKTSVEAIYREQDKFKLTYLYTTYSPEYQLSPYPNTFELRSGAYMVQKLETLIGMCDNKVHCFPTQGSNTLHLFPASDGWYLSFPSRIHSREEIYVLLRYWFVCSYFQIKTGMFPLYLKNFKGDIFDEKFLNYLDHLEKSLCFKVIISS